MGNTIYGRKKRLNGKALLIGAGACIGTIGIADDDKISLKTYRSPAF